MLLHYLRNPLLVVVKEAPHLVEAMLVEGVHPFFWDFGTERCDQIGEGFLGLKSGVLQIAL